MTHDRAAVVDIIFTGMSVVVCEDTSERLSRSVGGRGVDPISYLYTSTLLLDRVSHSEKKEVCRTPEKVL